MEKDKRIEQGIKTKEKIMEAAIDILAEEGMTGLSAQKISTKAGVSKANIFHHFGTLDDVLSLIFEQLIEITSKSVRDIEASSLEEFFILIGDTTIKQANKHESTFVAMFHYFNHSLIEDSYKRRMLHFIDHLTQSIKLLIPDIEPVSSNRLDEVAESITITLDSLGMHYCLDKDEDKFQRLWKLQYTFYCDYLRILEM